MPAFADRTGLTPVRFARDVVRPWAVRSLPLIAMCALAGPVLYPVPMWISIPLGGLTALVLSLVRPSPDSRLPARRRDDPRAPGERAARRPASRCRRSSTRRSRDGVRHRSRRSVMRAGSSASRRCSAARWRAPRCRGPLKRAYEAVLDRLPGDRLVCRFPHGESVRLAAAFRQVTWNAEEYRAFKSDIARRRHRARRRRKPRRVCGAVRAMGRPGGAACSRSSRRPSARLGLERHVALNGLTGRVVVRPEAMAEQERDRAVSRVRPARRQPHHAARARRRARSHRRRDDEHRRVLPRAASAAPVHQGRRRRARSSTC